LWRWEQVSEKCPESGSSYRAERQSYRESKVGTY